MSTYIDVKYMVDTTPAVKIPREVLETDFFTSYCFFPDEILYELRENKNYSLFRKHSLPTTASVLQNAQNSVLPALPKSSKLIDLYTNKGNGDILLLSTVLDEQGKDLGKLFQSRWKIVTEDVRLGERAKIYSIDVINTSEFLHIIKDEMQKAQK